MSIDFSAFDKKVDLDELQKDVAKATEYKDVPNDKYIVGIESMEIKPTKAGDKLMFAVSVKIKEGTYKGRSLFFNRVIYGNKSTENWNDGRAIKSVCTWLDKLATQTVPEFINYSDFAECVLDIFQEVQGTVELEIDWKANDFNPMSIEDVFEC